MFAQNDANFIKNNIAVDKHVCVEQLRYDKNVVDLDKQKEEDYVFKLLYTQFLELETFLPTLELKEFYQKLC